MSSIVISSPWDISPFDLENITCHSDEYEPRSTCVIEYYGLIFIWTENEVFLCTRDRKFR